MRYLLYLLPLLTTVHAQLGTQYYWWRYAGTDAPYQDIECIRTKPKPTIQALEWMCGNLTNCVAFNSNGCLKNSTASLSGNQPCDLYVKSTTPSSNSSSLPLWPLPVNMSLGANPVTVVPQLKFTTTNPSTDLTNAFTRIKDVIFIHNLPSAVLTSSRSMDTSTAAGNNPLLTTVNVNVADTNVPLQFGVDESYTLTIPNDGTPATITAKTIYGAYYGLQTLSQVIQWNPDSKTYTISVTPVQISDAPRFSWRGLMIDTDRHYLPLTTIFKIIDSLPYVKMNTLHWHIVDWQAWPLESAAYPLLWSAAWSYTERYTFEDVAMVVEYARERGIRVMPEFDTPGHAGSMCTGYPDICPSPTCTMPLNPASPNTLPTIQAVLQEIAAVTTDNYFHLGGDEVDTTCWSNTSSVVAWMKEHNYTTDQTYEYFVANVDQMALNINRIPVRWEEVWNHFGTQLDPRTIIHMWLSASTMIDVVNKGYGAIWSVNSDYYLPHLSVNWTSFYDVDILKGITNITARQFVYGGEVAMWGEWADGSEILPTIYPRAAAAAERWWSYNVVTNHTMNGVAERLAAFRCLLLERGMQAAPLNNAVARDAPTGPGSCINQ